MGIGEAEEELEMLSRRASEREAERDGNQPEDEMLESSLQILTCFADLLRDVGTEGILPADASKMTPDEQVVHRFIEEVGKSAKHHGRKPTRTKQKSGKPGFRGKSRSGG